MCGIDIFVISVILCSRDITGRSGYCDYRKSDRAPGDVFTITIFMYSAEEQFGHYRPNCFFIHLVYFILNIADGLYDRMDFKMPNAAKKKKPPQRR